MTVTPVERIGKAGLVDVEAGSGHDQDHRGRHQGRRGGVAPADARALRGPDPLAIQLRPALGAFDQVRLEQGPLRQGHLSRDEERKSPAYVLALHPASIFHISHPL